MKLDCSGENHIFKAKIFMQKIWIMLGAILFISSGIKAQIQSVKNPPSFYNSEILTPLPYLPIQLDTSRTEIDESYKKLHFAHKAPIDFNFGNYSVKDTVGDIIIERIGFISPGAKSLYFELTNFELQSGQEFYYYSPNKEIVRGAFTEKVNTHDGLIAFSPLPGDSIVLELISTLDANPRSDFKIHNLYHDFLGIVKKPQLGSTKGLSAGFCEIDINCYEGIDWQREKRAVCRIISGGQLCTGSLVNNLKEDGRPFLLTANHCINNQIQASNSVFLFNYEAADCYGTEGSSEQSISGGQLRATTYHLDFALLELQHAPPPSYQPYYLGLYLENQSAKHTTVIHHPQGDFKKISKDFESPATASYGGGYDNHSHWQVFQWDLGTTEGGSSGSPLINENHLVVGTLTGGEATCTHLINDYFSKINLAWDAYAMPSQQLRFWLDPDTINPSFIRGFDPYAFNELPQADFSTINPQVLAGRSIDLIDISSANPNSWSWSLPGGSINPSSLTNPDKVFYHNSGDYPISLTVTNNLGSDQIQKEDFVKVREVCLSASNFSEGESFQLLHTNNGDYWTGSNSYFVSEIAERFRFPTNDYWIHGVHVLPGLVQAELSPNLIQIKIWEGASHPGVVLYNQTYPLETLNQNEWNYLKFDNPIYIDGNFYAGYSISGETSNAVVLEQTPSRGIDGPSSIYLNSPIGWRKINFLDSSLTSSLAIKVELCEAFNSNMKQSRTANSVIYPNPSSDVCYLESDEIISHIRMFEITGKELKIPAKRISQYQMEISTASLSPGLYWLEIRTGESISFKQVIKNN